QETQRFLSLSAFAYGVDPETPASVQCDNIDARLASMSDRELLDSSHAGLAGIESPEVIAQLRPRLEAFLKALCPAPAPSQALRRVVDWLSQRYRSLGRPQPFLWYGGLLLLVVLIPWARRYLMLLATIGVVLMNHAVISALIFDVQPRYVVVTNPLRAILLCTLL